MNKALSTAWLDTFGRVYNVSPKGQPPAFRMKYGLTHVSHFQNNWQVWAAFPYLK